MKQVVRHITRLVYQRLAKPLLFRHHPDGVHDGLLRVGRIVQRVPLVNLLPRLWSHRDEEMLTQIVHGVTFHNPVGLSAGFDKNIELVPLMRQVGFGFMTGGSVTLHRCDGNPRPWFHRLPRARSLVVHAGLPNQGVRAISRRIRRYPRSLLSDFPLVVSVAKTNSPETVSDEQAIDDYIGSLAQLERTQRVAQYEINISCPNTYGGEPFTTPTRLDQLLSAIDELELERPIYIKMPIDLDWEGFRALLQVARRHKIQGVTIGNLRKDRDGVDHGGDLTDDMHGNLSGEPTRDITTELIRRTYDEFGGELTIIGVGGVFDAEHAYAKIRAGATLVALITGMIFEGPQVVGQINRDLTQLLRADGYTDIAQAIGADHRE